MEVHIDHAIRSYSSGSRESPEIIAHLFCGLAQCVGTLSHIVPIVLHLEPSENGNGNYYLYTLEKVVDGKETLGDGKVSPTVSRPSSSSTHLSQLMSDFDTKEVIYTRSLNPETFVKMEKPAKKKWSLLQVRKTPSFTNYTLRYQVWKVQTKKTIAAIETRISKMNTDKQDGVSLRCQRRCLLYFHYTCSIEDAESICESTLGVLQLLHTASAHKHAKRESGLKEKIYNEVIKTMTVPLLVFGRHVTNVSSDGSVPLSMNRSSAKRTISSGSVILNSDSSDSEEFDPKQMTCVFANRAFYQLTKYPHWISAEDSPYRNEGKLFSSFLSCPPIREGIIDIMSNNNTSGSNNGSGGLLSSRSSETPCLEPIQLLQYQDSVFPKSDYEIVIYRVNGTRVGIVINDISEKIKHLNLIEQASRAKTDFLANINHEFRTPLNSIDGNLQLLMRTSPLNDRQRDLINRMRLASTNLMSLLQEVFDYAKLEQHHMKLRDEIFSLRHVIQSTLDVMAAAATEQKTKLGFTMELDVPTLVIGDSFRLQQILVNLVSNAISHTKNGEVEITIVTIRGERLHFSVKDTGSGIDEEMQSRLFLPWSYGSSLEPNNGTGLGLAICKELCELMGGKIWLEKSVKGKGSIFSFEIEMKAADDSMTIGERAKQEVSLLKGKQVLLLNHIENDRKQVVKWLLSWGVKPTFCTTVEEVRDYLSADDYHFDVFILSGLCGPCSQGSLSDTKGTASSPLLQPLDLDQEEMENEIISLAKEISAKFPTSHLIAYGDEKSLFDDTCNQYFKKVLPLPITMNNLFRVLVNLSDASNLLVHGGEVDKGKGNQKEDKKSKAKNLSFLIVEDTPENSTVLLEMLQELGYSNIHCAGNGQEMLEYLEENQVDVVLVDLLMPVMNGLDAVRKYREKTKAPLGSRPVIVTVTATGILSDDPQQFHKAGMDAFIQKPIKMQELKTLLCVVEEGENNLA